MRILNMVNRRGQTLSFPREAEMGSRLQVLHRINVSEEVGHAWIRRHEAIDLLIGLQVEPSERVVEVADILKILLHLHWLLLRGVTVTH